MPNFSPLNKFYVWGCAAHFFLDPASTSFGKLINPKWDTLFGFQVLLVSRKCSFSDYLTESVCMCVQLKNLVMGPCGLQDSPPPTPLNLDLSLASCWACIMFSLHIASYTYILYCSTIFLYCWQLQLPLSSQGCNALFKASFIHVTHIDLARLPQTEKTLRLASVQWKVLIWFQVAGLHSSRSFSLIQTEYFESC